LPKQDVKNNTKTPVIHYGLRMSLASRDDVSCQCFWGWRALKIPYVAQKNVYVHTSSWSCKYTQVILHTA